MVESIDYSGDSSSGNRNRQIVNSENGFLWPYYMITVAAIADRAWLSGCMENETAWLHVYMKKTLANKLSNMVNSSCHCLIYNPYTGILLACRAAHKIECTMAPHTAATLIDSAHRLCVCAGWLKAPKSKMAIECLLTALISSNQLISIDEYFLLL